MERFRILIIDDDEDQHEILGEYLLLAGYAVDHAMNGADGLSALERDGADLVLLDVRMPVMDGFATLKAKQANSQIRDIPVLMLTSLDKSHLKVKGLELGAEDYLTKPCNKAELLARVRVALRRAPRYQRNLAAMEGNLADLPLAELLQTLELAGRPARVQLHELGAELILGSGGDLWATQGDHRGQQALDRLILLNRGLFSVTFDADTATTPTDDAPIALRGALMGALTRLDEVTAALERIGGLEDPVELDGDATLPPGVAPFCELCPMPLGTLLVQLPGDLADNIETLAQLQTDNKLRVLQ